MLRNLLAQEELVTAVGLYDCMAAKLAEKAGFKAITIQGSGQSACLLGYMDVGLLTMTEIVSHNRNIVNAVNIPVLVDADTGYGGPIHIQRTVREFERAGVACVRLEDQPYPFSASHNEEGAMQVCSQEEMIMRIKAAQDAREDPDLVICARTDAGVLSVDEAIRRCNAYAEAGADLVMPLPLANLEQYEAAAKGIKAPLWVLLNPASDLTPRVLEGVGVRGIVSFSRHMQIAVARVMQILLEEFTSGGSGKQTLTWLGPWAGETMSSVMGLPGLIEVEKRFTVTKGNNSKW